MDRLQKEILKTLTEAYEEDNSRWIPAFALVEILKHSGTLTTVERLIPKVEMLATQGFVDFSPSVIDGRVQGFTVRLAMRGFLQYHYNRPSLIR